MFETVSQTCRLSTTTIGENAMNWIEPAYCDVRLGFEVTAYVFVR
jgi:coenzyme PQQ precursor peptide PqqA